MDVVFDLVAKLRDSGRTLLVVEQNALRMLDAADRAYVMRSGEMVAHGPAEELKARSDLFDTYVGKASPS